jgi:hypothetical protein
MIKPQDLISELESMIDYIKENGYSRPSVHDIRDNLLGLVDSLYCEHWCDDEDDCCYDDHACVDCEYKEDCENANLPDDDDEDEEE